VKVVSPVLKEYDMISGRMQEACDEEKKEIGSLIFFFSYYF
jgi:hypothetical protein